MNIDIEKNGLLVEVVHNYRTYFVPEATLKEADALQMPDGTFLDLRKTGIEYDYARTPSRYRLIGTTSEYERWGRLPTLNVIELQEEEAHKPN